MATPNRIPGRATAAGTERYRQRFAGRLAEDHFRNINGWWLSSIGIGTYLGEPDVADDERYRDAIVSAVRSGCNVIDTAVNYRFQRSERSVGAALRILTTEGFERDEIVVATKGGFIPFDGGMPEDPSSWFRSSLLETGIAEPRDVVANCHIMTPRYLRSQIEWSLGNLGVESIDIYYVHNPETQLPHIERAEFLMRLRGAFELLEEMAAADTIGVYGVATWDGFRVPPGHPSHLSLAEIETVAVPARSGVNHFRALQLPVNMVMSEACLAPTQRLGDQPVSLVEAARQAGTIVMSSGSLLQGKLVGQLGDALRGLVPGARTDAQCGIQVIRSVPGLSTALVGMKQVPHVEENLEIARHPRLGAADALRILGALSSSDPTG